MTGRMFQRGVAIVLLCVTSLNAADDDFAKQLEERGVRVTSSAATMIAETELSRGLRSVARLRRDIALSVKKYEDFKKSVNLLDAQIAEMNRQVTNLSAQLANVTNVAQNNRLVGAINTVEGRLRQAYQQKEKAIESEGQIHGQISSARDAFVSHLIAMRKYADEASEGYRNTDHEVANLLKQHNAAKGTELKLEATSTFDSSLRKLAELEDQVLTEEIPLRRDGKTYWAGVSINEEHVVEMVVDSGANLVTLPYETAVKIGIKPGDDDPEIGLVVADGRTISGYKMMLKSVRVGDFVVNDVECAVLGPEATNAPPLLGMTFLGDFKFEIDAGKATLRMTEVDDGSEKRSRRSSGRSSLEK